MVSSAVLRRGDTGDTKTTNQTPPINQYDEEVFDSKASRLV